MNANLPQGKWKRWCEHWQLGVRILALLAIAHACNSEIDFLPSSRDIGGGLVVTPEKQVVDVYSMPGAISAEEAAFLVATDVGIKMDRFELALEHCDHPPRATMARELNRAMHLVC